MVDEKNIRAREQGPNNLTDLDEEIQEIEKDDREQITDQPAVYDGKNLQNRITSLPLLSAEEERSLAREYAETGSQTARNTLIMRNQRLVAYEAKKYLSYGVPFDDLFQEGNIGLMRAVDKFDYKQNNRFSTYALWWIRQAIWRAIQNTGNTIRLPVGLSTTINQVKRYTSRFYAANGRRPTDDEIMASLDISKDRLAVVKDVQANMTPVSLSTPIDENGVELLEVVTDDSEKEDIIGEEVRHQTLMRALHKNLNADEVEILTRRYGLNGKQAETLEQIGNDRGVSKERIRQIQREAEKKLSHNKELRELFAVFYA